MNLVHGKMIDESACGGVLDRLGGMIFDTLAKPPLDTERVVGACDRMVKNFDRAALVKKASALGVNPALIDMYAAQIESMLGADALRARLKAELGDLYAAPRRLRYRHSGAEASQFLAPLGVLFHITAGNADGLPFISLLEGLLTGNINIIKLPKEEGGVTAALLEELFRADPSLSEYVYVFDYSSKDIDAMQKLASLADAVVVWGGDEAVKAVRKLVDPNTSVIEWGHKISFAYVTKDGLKRESLEKLAAHICLTDQLFCSSCQGVFFDTDGIDGVYEFCEAFLPILENAAVNNPSAANAAARWFIDAGVTLQQYHERLTYPSGDRRLFSGEHCSVTAYADAKLATSDMYRNLWVKPLKRDEILKTLRPYKNYLQTAALLCGADERKELTGLLLKTGIVKISDGFEMSNYAVNEAHDGCFPLRRYTKIVSVQEL